MTTALAERRLAAIMAVDVVGYSRLVEADEAGTLAAIKGLRREVIDPLLARHRGRVAKLMGDGLIIEFASVVDAVACAAAVQEAAAERQAGAPPERRIVLRIGINLGDVVVEGDGDLLGDGVNVAARLEQLCEPGGVLVSGTVYDHLQGKLDLPLEFAGERRLKNIKRPVRAYRVRLVGGPARPRALLTRRSAALACAASLLILAVAAGGWWLGWVPPGAAPAPATVVGVPAPPSAAQASLAAPAAAPMSVVVLPFANLSDDPEQEYFADGITDDLTTDLSRIDGSLVIARHTAFTYKGRPVDLREVGRELGVRYVLQGVIRSCS